MSKEASQVLGEKMRNEAEMMDTWHNLLGLGNWYQSCSICLF